MRQLLTNQTKLVGGKVAVFRILMAMMLLIVTSSATAERDGLLEYAESESIVEHRLAAEYYRNKALEADVEAQAHQELLEKYEERGLTIVARHCSAIAKRFSEIASQYESMAGEHTMMAEAR